MTMAQRRPNVVLFPFLAQSHIIPFLALAQHIAQKGYSITFVNTPLNIRNLQKSLPQAFSSSITFAELPFNSSDHGLPPDIESTDSLPGRLMGQFIRAATSSLSLPFKNLISHLVTDDQDCHKPICVISDFFFSWVSDISHEFGIFHAIFGTVGGFGMACYYSMWLNLPHTRSSDQNFLLPDFPEAGKMRTNQVLPPILSSRENDPGTIFNQRMLTAWANSDALILNTLEDVDEKGLMYFRRKLGIHVWGIGPVLLPEQYRSKHTTCAKECIDWLDRKEADSVIYISFGSQNVNAISASQMMELAKALDASGKNFMWVLRPPVEFDTNAEVEFVPEEWLPDGFVRRVQDEERGLIVEKWAPQMEILAHESVGVFISHCGWNSVLEALKNGVPILSLPMGGDQIYNAKFLVEEVGVCVELARGSNFQVVQEDIMEKIELVMGENERGKEIRRKAEEIKEMVRDAMRDEDDYKGSSVKAMEEFFKAAKLKS
uniref:Glycosyltransferase n=1 Tax=Scoparia dulcis TaxID=107240 RepID=A0A5H2Q6E1_SCODU|nr:UDP-glycosyltransferase [Scoparia dulcis]